MTETGSTASRLNQINTHIMKTFIALFTFVQYGELHSNIRHIQAKSWESALDLTSQLLEEIYRTMQADGVTAVQLQSLTITNP